MTDQPDTDTTEDATEAPADEAGFTNSEGGELAVQDQDDDDAGTLEVFPPARRPMSEARAMLGEHRAMLEDAHFTANVVCQTAAAPQRYRGKVKEGTVAIMYGAELGLPPMASLQKVINIHGMPSLEARTMKGLLKTKGFQFRTIIKTEDEFEIHAWEPTSNKRTDPPDEIAHWTMARAVKARYVPIPASDDSLRRPDVDTDWVTVTKTWEGRAKTSVLGNMKYITDPITMLEAKGTADVCRAIAPEILMGLPYAAEERDDWLADDEDDDEPARQASRARGVSKLRDRAKAAKAGATAADAAADTEDAETCEAPVEPARSPADIANERDQAGADWTAENEQASEPAAEPVEQQDMSPPASSGRAKAEDELDALLMSASIGKDDRPGVVAEILAKREGKYREVLAFDALELPDPELRYVLEVLRAHQARGDIYNYCGEAVNAAELRASGLT